jgi:hypothetical protein
VSGHEVGAAVRALYVLGPGDPEEVQPGTPGTVTEVSPLHRAYRYRVDFGPGRDWLVKPDEIEAAP